MSPTRHVPTVMDDPRDDLSEPDRALIEDVEKYGFHYITVGQSAADAEYFPDWQDVPNWTYSIGLYVSFRHPEIVVFTLDSEIAGPLLWDLVRAIEAGQRFEPGRIYEDALPSFPGQTCSFEAVSSAWAPSLFGYARWFYKGAEFPVLQYVWPDRNGRFPWEEGATEALRAAQPDLTAIPAHENAPPPSRSGEHGD